MVTVRSPWKFRADSRIEDLFAQCVARYPELAEHRERDRRLPQSRICRLDDPAPRRGRNSLPAARQRRLTAPQCQPLPPTISSTSAASRSIRLRSSATSGPTATAPSSPSTAAFAIIPMAAARSISTTKLMNRWRLKKLNEIAAEIHAKFAIDRVAIAHRLGRLEIGETSVFIAVSAAHRAAAFDACRFAHRHAQAHRAHLEERVFRRRRHLGRRGVAPAADPMPPPLAASAVGHAELRKPHPNIPMPPTPRCTNPSRLAPALR